MPVLGSCRARLPVSGAPVGPRPLEDLEVPVKGSVRARACVPGAPVGARPLEDLEVPALSGVIAQEPPERRPRRSFKTA